MPFLAKVNKMLQIYNALKSSHRGLAATALASVLLLSGPAIADSGFYIGGSVGNSTLQVDFEDPIGGGSLTFDENDFSWKAYGGFMFDLPVLNLGVEGGYRDLGGPSATLAAETYGIDVTAF